MLLSPFKLVIVVDDEITVNVPDKTIERLAAICKLFRDALSLFASLTTAIVNSLLLRAY